MVLTGAAWFLVAGEAGWISSEIADRWVLPLATLGGLCFALGALVSVLDPALRWATRKRCVRCGAPTERGQVYCLDHLRATVHEAQDTTRHNVQRRGR